jgi:hypothetical protein
MHRYELAVLWSDHTWTDEHYVMADDEEDAIDNLKEELRDCPRTAAHITVLGFTMESDLEDEDGEAVER